LRRKLISKRETLKKKFSSQTLENQKENAKARNLDREEKFIMD